MTAPTRPVTAAKALTNMTGTLGQIESKQDDLIKTTAKLEVRVEAQATDIGTIKGDLRRVEKSVGTLTGGIK